MSRTKYDYKTGAEFKSALDARSSHANRVVEFWIREDEEFCHFLACWSPRNTKMILAYVSPSGNLEAYLEDTVEGFASDHNSYHYLLWDAALKRGRELLELQTEQA